MAIDVKTLIAQLRKAPRVIRVIAIVAAVDAVIILYALFSLADDVDQRVAKIDQLRTQLSEAQQKIEQTRKQIARLPELRKHYDAALANGVLAQQDRLKFVALAQDLAKDNRLGDFHFKLEPEVLTGLPGNKYRLVSTNVSLSDNALRDSDVIAFWDQILDKSQAHYEVTKAVIERVPAIEVKDILPNLKNGAPASLMKAEIAFRWQSLRQQSEVETTIKASTAAPAATPATQAAK